MLEPAESASASQRLSSAEASLHTASRFQRSARTVRRTRARRARTEKPRRASAPAPSAVFVRFQFVVIVLSPAVSRGRSVRFPGPVFGSRSGLSGPPFRPPFERVQVSENRVKPEVSFRRRPSSGTPGPASVRPARLRSREAGFQFVRQVPPPSRCSGLPPGPGLLFRSFAVRFVHGSYLKFVLYSFQFVLRSFQFVLRSPSLCPSCSLRSCSFPFILPFRSSCSSFRSF